MAFAAAIFSMPSFALATEIVVKNDSLGPGTPLARYPAGTRVGVRLTAPENGNIVGVQIVWGSTQGSAAPTEQLAITISEENPQFSWQPGTTLATIESPTLLDGGVNEFRFLDPSTNLIPLDVPVIVGETYFIDLALAGPSTNSLAPGVLYDGNFQSGRNFLTALGGWAPFELLVVPAGDFGIRAIIATVPEPSGVVLSAIGAFWLIAYAARTNRRARTKA